MVQTILFDCARNPPVRGKPEKTRNSEYYSGILCKIDQASAKKPS